MPLFIHHTVGAVYYDILLFLVMWNADKRNLPTLSQIQTNLIIFLPVCTLCFWVFVFDVHKHWLRDSKRYDWLFVCDCGVRAWKQRESEHWSIQHLNCLLISSDCIIYKETGSTRKRRKGQKRNRTGMVMQGRDIIWKETRS